MRRSLLVVGAGALAAVIATACSSSDGGAAPESAPDGADGGGGGGGDTGAATDGPTRGSFTLSTVKDTTIVVGRTATVSVSVTRGEQLSEPITVTVSGLPAGVTAAPLTLSGSTGDLALTASANAALGASTAIITATVTPNGGAAITLTTTLKLTVRAAPGSVDVSWGDQGSVGGLFGDAFDNAFVELLLAPDDSVYAVGLCRTSAQDAACAAHIKADGTIDTTYGTNGYAVLGSATNPYGATLQTDASITVVGGSGASFNGYIARMNKDGVADQTGAFSAGFNGNGSLGTIGYMSGPFSDIGNYFVLQRKNDGDLLIGYDNDNGGTQPGTIDLRVDGSLNTAYGSSGRARNGTGQIVALTIRDDAAPKDGTLATVWVDGSSIRYQESNARTGAPVGTAQSLTAAGVSRSTALTGHAQLADGSLVVPINASNGLGFDLVKFSPSGAAATFGVGGLAGPFATHGNATGIVLQADGKFVVAVQASVGAADNEILMRFGATGALDTEFGAAGVVTNKTGTKSRSQKVVVQKSGRIIATVAEDTPTRDAILMAYVP